MAGMRVYIRSRNGLDSVQTQSLLVSGLPQSDNTDDGIAEAQLSMALNGVPVTIEEQVCRYVFACVTMEEQITIFSCRIG